MPWLAATVAADDVATADHQALLDLGMDRAYLSGQPTEHRGIVAELALAHQDLARHLQKHAMEA